MEDSNYWKQVFEKRLSRRRLFRNVTIGGVGLALTGSIGCNSGGSEQPRTSSTSSQPKRGGIWQSAMASDPVHWDPHQTVSSQTHVPIMYCNATLLAYPAGPKYDAGDATPMPNLAESWDQPDDTTYIFKLRKGVKWHNKPPVNGREFVADDVKYSFERIQRVNSPFKGMYEKIAKIEVPDKYTVKMTLSEPFAPILNFLAHYYGQILAREVEEKYGDFKKPETVIGLGPFMLESYEPNAKIVYKRHPEYFMPGLPYLDGVEIISNADDAANLANFRAGKFAVRATNLTELPTLKSTNPDISVFEMYDVIGSIINFRTDKPPFNDKRFRQAVSLSIDRKAWLDKYLNGKGYPVNGPIQTLWKEWSLPVEQRGAGADFLKLDINKAKQLLADVGYADGLKSSFEFTNGYGSKRTEDTEIVKDMASKIGVGLDIKIMEYAAYIVAVMNSNPTYLGMSYAIVRFMGDPDEPLWEMYHPKGSKNFSKVNDPKLTEMIERQRRILNTVERKKVVDEIQRYIADQCFYVYAPAPITMTAYHPWLKNYRPSFTYDMGSILREVWFDK